MSTELPNIHDYNRDHLYFEGEGGEVLIHNITKHCAYLDDHYTVKDLKEIIEVMERMKNLPHEIY